MILFYPSHLQCFGVLIIIRYALCSLLCVDDLSARSPRIINSTPNAYTNVSTHEVTKTLYIELITENMNGNVMQMK